jgi:translation initiation factor IF-1
MKNQLQTLRRKAAVVILGGALLAPVLAITAVSEAAPSSRAWHYVDRDNRRSDSNRVVTGTVTKDLAGHDRFTVRLDTGRTTEVISRRDEPVRLSRGDRVELRGDFERDLFIADSVQILRNEGRGNGSHQEQTTLNGRVSRDYSGRNFEVRTDSGRSVTVRSERGEPVRLSRGDRVELFGHFDKGIFVARDVDILRNR